MTIRDDLALKGSIWRYGDAKQLPAEEIERIAANLKKEKEKTVTQYDLTGKRLNIFPSTTDAAQITGTHFNSIRCVLNGYKATGGFIWRSIPARF